MIQRSFFLLGLFLVALPTNAFAYIDPASGSLVLQVISAAVLASLLTFRRVWQWVGNLLRDLREKAKRA